MLRSSCHLEQSGPVSVLERQMVALWLGSTTPSSWSWASVVHVVCSCCWLGCRSRGDGSRVGCLSLLHAKSLPMESHLESLVRSLLSLFVCRYALMSSSHLLASLPCFRYPFCLVDIAGLQMEVSFVQRPVWYLAIIIACFQFVSCSV